MDVGNAGRGDPTADFKYLKSLATHMELDFRPSTSPRS